MAGVDSVVPVIPEPLEELETLPKTGEKRNVLSLGSLMGSLILMLAFELEKRRKKKEW